MDKKSLMEFGLRALREQTPPIPKVRPPLNVPPIPKRRPPAPPRPDVFGDAERGDITVNRGFNAYSYEQGKKMPEPGSI